MIHRRHDSSHQEECATLHAYIVLYAYIVSYAYIVLYALHSHTTAAAPQPSKRTTRIQGKHRKQMDMQIEAWIDRQANRWTDRRSYSQPVRQATDSRTDRKTDLQMTLMTAPSQSGCWALLHVKTCPLAAPMQQCAALKLLHTR